LVTPDLSPDDRLIPSEQIMMRELSGESVLLDLKSGVYFGLNGVGTRIWTLMNEGGSLEDVGRVLCDEFDVAPPDVRGDVLRFASELCAHGLCHVAPPR
jgi:hypothetical protein